ncbi:Short chain fatty acid transporter [Burkholderia lata]|uniref:Short chain fatty acid transporter n=1 Tax=Burkholderia lata (strain ATCC 17760 / DSM 23089 / LMG 22485 / NCIMB 9086 / R18194 / 383) TaxID=482957 RepID=A0A6P2QFU6_BURL3|nr:Short chain fatty acid transporter [Burkholderia lata]
MGGYSAVLGFFVPSGGGKWIIEAPYVIEAAKLLHVHLGWAVTVYNAAGALPNLVNPFWMLPLLGVLGLRARDIVGFTFTQLMRASAARDFHALGSCEHAQLPSASHAVTNVRLVCLRRISCDASMGDRFRSQ